MFSYMFFYLSFCLFFFFFKKGCDFVAAEATEIFSQSVWGAGVAVGLDGFEGSVYHMMTYIPYFSGVNVRLDLYQVEQTTGNR
jgi:hypothetical protein